MKNENFKKSFPNQLSFLAGPNLSTFYKTNLADFQILMRGKTMLKTQELNWLVIEK